MTAYRETRDSMGVVRVPATAYYGAQTQRAVDNFPISGLALPPTFIQALAMVKKAAAEVNAALGLLDAEAADAIVQAAEEVIEGRRYDQFVVDVFQTGSGTSTNMNMNEVLACRANEILTGTKSDRSPVHPNDHVNQGQSSNDVIPTTIHLAACLQWRRHLDPALQKLEAELSRQAGLMAGVRKIGRTHLQDAVPITLGDEFGAYARQIELARERLQAVEPRLQELALGGTAVGSGLNTHPEFAARAIQRLAASTDIPLREAVNHYQAQAAQETAVELSGALKALAVALVKIANDLRWLASGPRCGLGEINLPALQPGSSIMPGKVNPVIPEMLIQVAAQVVGNDATLAMAGTGGNFELNVMLPVIAFNLLQSIELLGNACGVAAEKCIRDIRANPDKCAAYIEQSLALVTGLVPHIGYDRAAELAYEAHRSGRTVREVARASNLVDEETLSDVLG
ncbi:MAG: class II fumarate hydratase [Desulfobacterales bacterium]|nr:class II fumarate hydratase [Desulfobacterales bacterium]MDJ0991191.1 class II fumarate hydratase [Desulfobacterales bacterium]